MRRIAAAALTALVAPLWVGGASAQAAEITPAQLSVGASTQVIVVTSSGWRATHATLQTWQRNRDGTWVKPFGSMSARIGYNGFKLDAERRQNSGTTPAGNYRIRATFGVSDNPGTKMPYRDFDANDYWVYDPRDPKTYNILEPYRTSGSDWRTKEAERLADLRRQYRYAAVIGYNLPTGVYWSRSQREYRTRTPADTTKGGGIFLHVNGPGATSGCVSLYRSSMLKVLTWLDPAQQPRIIMGPRSVITKLG
jgi:L,D-peptidoglycan transpeptidase YkuD (ErfK/YbiS/YcfS/YnhG family)